MLRVSKVEDWLRRAPSRPDLSTHGDCVIIRSTECYDGKQGVSLASGVSSSTTGARALCLHLVMIPPGTRGVPHFHAGHESAIYTVSGENEVWHGAGLANRTVVRAGDFMYIPPGIPHLPVNRGDVTVIAVVARTDAEEQESVVVIDLPRHLAGLSDLPIAVQELPTGVTNNPRTRFPPRRGEPGRHGGPPSSAAAPNPPARVHRRLAAVPRWCSSGGRGHIG